MQLFNCFKPSISKKIAPSTTQNTTQNSIQASSNALPDCNENLEHAKSWVKKESSYEIFQPLKQEQFSRVYLAQSQSDGTYAFVKILHKKEILKRDSISRVEAEVEALTNLSHPFLNRMIGFTQDEKSLFIILELVEGGDLASLIKQAKLSKSDAAFFASQIVHIIDYLQMMNVIHRDLTPQNFLLTEDSYLKLTNFGSAKCLEKNNRTYTQCGTPTYMAPEIILGTGHGKEVDWWCLGVIVYEMLTGIDPFYNNDPMYMYQKIANCQVDFPSDLDKQAKNLVSQLLVSNPETRAFNASNIKKHKFFHGIDWDKLMLKKLSAKVKPSKINFKNVKTKLPSLDSDELIPSLKPSEDPFLYW